jgi:hypothetical protein
MRRLFVVLAIVFFVSSAAPVMASLFTVDGSAADWQAAGLYLNSPISPPQGALHITHYGATVSSGTFYAFIELDRPVSDFTRMYPGAWIDVDHNVATSAGNLPFGAGLDLNLEYDYDSPSSIALNYYGGADITGDSIPVTGGAYASAGNVLEFSAPISGMSSALVTLNATYPGASPALSISSPMTVYIGGEGKINSGDDWGVCIGGPVSVTVPEPGAMAMLAAAGLAIALMGLRGRRP